MSRAHEKIRLLFGGAFGLFFQTAGATLREIFDESAYTRFLERTGQSSSRAAYAGFLRERAAQHERRPHCC